MDSLFLSILTKYYQEKYQWRIYYFISDDNTFVPLLETNVKFTETSFISLHIILYYVWWCQKGPNGSAINWIEVATIKRLKLYYGYKYTRPCMIYRIWGLNNYNYWWKVMLDFIWMGSAGLFGTAREQKMQNENICLKRDSNQHPALHDR